MPLRTEFGVPRTTCACYGCVTNCRFMPGFLIPTDLDRLLQGVTDPFAWAEHNLLASPGATAMNTSTGNIFQIRTLVPAVKSDGSCIHLTDNLQCGIHANAPFGCAFFDCGPEREGLNLRGLTQCRDFFEGGLYGLVWRRLWADGKRQKPPFELRERMRREM